MKEGDAFAVSGSADVAAGLSSICSFFGFCSLRAASDARAVCGRGIWLGSMRDLEEAEDLGVPDLMEWLVGVAGLPVAAGLPPAWGPGAAAGAGAPEGSCSDAAALGVSRWLCLDRRSRHPFVLASFAC